MIVSSLSFLFLFFSSYRFFSFVLFFFVNFFFFSSQILLRTVQIVNPTTIKKAEETKEVKKQKKKPEYVYALMKAFLVST